MIGICILSGNDWESWQLPLLRNWKPPVVRLQIAYDNHPEWLSITESQMRDLEAICSTIIVRTCETQIQDYTVWRTLQAPFKDSSLTLLQWIQQTSCKVIIEVGNEPDLGGADPWQFRWNLLNTQKKLQPMLPSTVEWGASLATDVAYNTILFTRLADGCILDSYDYLMPHCYGHHSFNASDGAKPRDVLNQALATKKKIWITEFGINSPDLTWVQKATLYKEFIRNANVEGGTIFALSTDPDWVVHTHYGLDVSPQQVRDYTFAGVQVLKEPFMIKESNMGNVPKPNIVENLITKLPGVGRDKQDRQRVPKFTVDHSMVGTLEGTNSWFARKDVAALTDFGVGLADTGNGYAKIYQWNDLHGTQIGWASGPVLEPFGDGPTILSLFGGASGLNQFGVSIEHDDGGKPTNPVSAAQWSATVWLHAWIHAEELGQTAATFKYNTHHREFCGTGYKDCPFPRIYNFTTEFHAAIKAVMAHWQEDKPYPTEGVFINGKKLTVPTNKAGETTVTKKTLKAGEWQTYINAKGETIVELNFGGFAEKILGTDGDIGTLVENDGVKYHRSWRKGQMLEWEGV